jgi:CelD/BcsL family acetyltransferase involved in cellulose biosynthesis
VSVRIDCIDSDTRLPALLPEWEALWQRLPNAMPFQSPAWLMAWWRQFGTSAPRILTARNSGMLLGVLPLYELDEAGRRKLLPIGIGLSDYMDALVDPAPPEAADRLLGAISDVPDWDECHLPDLPPGSRLARAPCPPALQENVADTVPCPVLQLPGSASDLAAAVPSKTLRDVHQAHKRSVATGRTCVELADSDTHGPVMEDLFALHAKRWEMRGETGVCADPAVRSFHSEAARALARTGMLRLYRLKIGERVTAVYYGFCCNGRAYAYLGGFDPDLPRLSPGAQILHHAIVEAIAEGCREFHFLRGGESYKYAWGATERWNRARTFRRA